MAERHTRTGPTSPPWPCGLRRSACCWSALRGRGRSHRCRRQRNENSRATPCGSLVSGWHRPPLVRYTGRNDSSPCRLPRETNSLARCVNVTRWNPKFADCRCRRIYPCEHSLRVPGCSVSGLERAPCGCFGFPALPRRSRWAQPVLLALVLCLIAFMQRRARIVFSGCLDTDRGVVSLSQSGIH